MPMTTMTVKYGDSGVYINVDTNAFTDAQYTHILGMGLYCYLELSNIDGLNPEDALARLYSGIQFVNGQVENDTGTN